MKQCEHYLENGERCSNQAVPGTYFCRRHGKIFFKPVTAEANEAPPQPDPGPAPTGPADFAAPDGPDSAPSEPDRRAVPCPAGRAPQFPGIRTDERGILIAPRGVVHLAAEAGPGTTDVFDRLVKLLGAMSQTLDLAGRVRIMRRGAAGDILVFVSPEGADEGGETAIYDAVSAAARLAGARLFIGTDNAFVQYRDHRAPKGCDMPGFQPPADSDRLALAGLRGVRTLPLSDFSDLDPADLCLGIAAQPVGTGGRPAMVYVLAPRPLHPILCRYFQKHHLRFGLTQLQTPDGEAVLFEISPRPDAPTGEAVPRFTLDYLSRLPRTVLLTPEIEADGRAVLVQWRHRFPLHLPHVAGLFAPDALMMLMGDGRAGLTASPRPVFHDGDRMVHVHAPRTAATQPTARASGPPKMTLPVRVRPDKGFTPPTAAVILDDQELAWLRTLLYRMPRAVFGSYSLCQGVGRSVLMGNRLPVEGVPFGVPLRRVRDASLFIPLRKTLVPEPPWEILRAALEIPDDVLVFITDDYRVDIPASDFAPLSRFLMADPDMPLVEMRLRKTAALPELKWTPPDRGDVKDAPVSGWRKLFSGGKDAATTPREEPTAKAPETGAGFADALREKAGQCEAEGDFLAAAVLFSLLGDRVNTARCYQRAVSAPEPEATPPIPEADRKKEAD